ncbi:PE-PGRS family protein PE_PGRS18 [Mycobacterium innocens]|uniref:PE-PGRS family protein PE_PGRS18 n=1 Tax=Mycobacterium innocens TaxID=2341083 RepID=A0A498Q1G7_9MYCO|nr:PE-PGRS family protein PE_PGRS18 [Mycobacterium innocens]
MVTCENGHQNPDDYRFCGECGAPIVPAMVLCPTGHLTSVNQPFCDECGAPIIGAAPSVAAGIIYANLPESGIGPWFRKVWGSWKNAKVRRVAIIVGSLLLVGALAVLGFSVINSGHERAGTTTTGPGSTAPVTHTVTATVAIGSLPNGVAVDSGTRTIYAVNHTVRGRVSVIDGKTHKVTATVPVGGSPVGATVDPGTHTVYVTNADFHAGDSTQLFS